MTQAIENPMVKYRDEKLVVIGHCEQCGTPIYDGYCYGEYEDAIFCDFICFHKWIGYREVR